MAIEQKLELLCATGRLRTHGEAYRPGVHFAGGIPCSGTVRVVYSLTGAPGFRTVAAKRRSFDAIGRSSPTVRTACTVSKASTSSRHPGLERKRRPVTAKDHATVQGNRRNGRFFHGVDDASHQLPPFRGNGYEDHRQDTGTTQLR